MSGYLHLSTEVRSFHDSQGPDSFASYLEYFAMLSFTVGISNLPLTSKSTQVIPYQTEQEMLSFEMVIGLKIRRLVA